MKPECERLVASFPQHGTNKSFRLYRENNLYSVSAWWAQRSEPCYLGHETFCYGHRVIFTVFQILQKFTNKKKKKRKY